MTTSWDFDLSHSGIHFTVRHLMVSRVRGHFGSWRGQLLIDPSDLTRSSVEVEIDAASVETKEPKRDEHLRSADFLDAANYPHLRFKGTRVEQVDDTTYKLHGDLTIRDVTRPVVLDVDDIEVRAAAHEELVVVQDGVVAVALDTTLDDELRLEGTARELVRAINDHRKAIGLDLADRIRVELRGTGSVLDAARRHGEWIAVTAEMGAGVLAGDPQDVGAVRGAEVATEDGKDTEERSEGFHAYFLRGGLRCHW